jgi:hypothetical protein
MVIRQTILQLKTPDEMRGRVSSVNSMFVGSSNELGAFESGLTAKLMGTGYRGSFWRHHDINNSSGYRGCKPNVKKPGSYKRFRRARKKLVN